jgi:CMP-N,N'-diacetyllegionaminic acid synthase
MFKGKKVLAVIPARGGSKGIPRKNLSKIGSLSLIGIVGELINKANWIDRKIISTDDDEIAEEGLKFHLEVPFLRSVDLSHDSASSIDMWVDAWTRAEEYYGEIYDVSILLEPTSPLRKLVHIEETISVLVESNAGCACTISKTPAHYTPHKSLVLNDHSDLGFFEINGKNHSLRQSIPDLYHRNGVCYAVTREQLMFKRELIGENTKGVLIGDVTVNIDDHFDLELANWLYSKSQINE